MRKRITVDGKQVYEYRVQVETVLGRKLRRLEHIHHLDGDVSNNEWTNLALMPRGIHTLLTRLEQHIDKIILFDPKGRSFSPVGIRFILYREERGRVSNSAGTEGDTQWEKETTE